MSVESLDIQTTNLNLDVQNGVTQTLEITDGVSLTLNLGVMGLQGPQGPAGTGDMQKSVYDTDNDGIVDAAESVPWTGVTGKPSLVQTSDIGVTVQAYDSDLTAWAGISTSSKQDTLVSGTNIKTVNSTSLLGSGNISIAPMVYPGAGVAVSTGSAWGTSKTSPTGDIVGTTDSQTLTDKTLQAVTLNDGYTEEVFAVSGTTPTLSPTNGSIQTWTLSGASTPTAGTWASGQSMTLMIDDGTTYTINWASVAVTWKTNAGVAPTLNTTGYTVVALWKVGTTIYGARVGDA